MAKTNRDRVGEGLELLSKGLLPFIEGEMKAVHGDKWKEEAAKSPAVTSEAGKKINWNDLQTALVVMWDQWNTVFRNTLGHSERSLVSELREVRNRWAHMENFGKNSGSGLAGMLLKGPIQKYVKI